MKLIDYILKFSFAFCLGLFIIFKGSPLIFNKAKELKQENLTEIKLEFLSVKYITPNDKSYIKIEGLLSNNKAFKRIYQTSERKHINLLNILTGNINSSKINMDQILPLELTQEHLLKLSDVRVNFNKSGNLDKLVINQQYIIGEKASYLRVIFVYFLGALTFTLGVLSLTVALIMAFRNLNIYRNTGKLPEIQNTFDSKIKGLEFFLKFFKGK
ncbi:hypothetical protein KO493_08760 [Tamlana agarivorans]|uniref:Uncharacterized protein n=1 Tax=Pseudotamlana agarivorans TaxID=481183 RepID=A0ACC5U904_9FLAO|nr:hypothetical protein [Tamlana agarivorans]MBU2950786.1 hypothetical protein [Tamlana agarivorans]